MRTAPWGGNAALLIPHPFDLQCPPDHFTSSLDSGASVGGRGGAGDGEGQAASIISTQTWEQEPLAMGRMVEFRRWLRDWCWTASPLGL